MIIIFFLIVFFYFFSHGIFFPPHIFFPWGVRTQSRLELALARPAARYGGACSALAPRYGGVRAPTVPSPRLCPSGCGLGGGATRASPGGLERAPALCVLAPCFLLLLPKRTDFDLHRRPRDALISRRLVAAGELSCGRPCVPASKTAARLSVPARAFSYRTVFCSPERLLRTRKLALVGPLPVAHPGGRAPALAGPQPAVPPGGSILGGRALCPRASRVLAHSS